MLAIITRISKQIRVNDELQFGNKLVLFTCQSTSLILFTFCAIITSQQYFGKPIQCIQDVNSDSALVPESVMNTFCFISHTYSNVEFKGNGEVANTNEVQRKHSYYPWVPILIFLQGFSFMVPLMLNSLNENSFLLYYLKQSTILLKTDVIPSMARYISKRLHDFSSWITNNLLSEIIYAINIIGNFILTDIFLGGNFIDYGYKAIQKEKMFEESVFPKMTKCSFFKYGPSGTIENREALCLMTLNILNEKFYLFLWFWLILLLCSAIIVMLDRLFFILVLLTRKKCKSIVKKLLASEISQGGFTVLIQKFSFSDWMLLKQIKSHMDSKFYNKLLENIALEISEPHDLVSNGLDANINFYEYISVYK